MVAPEEACPNLQRLAADGLRGDVRLLRGDRLHPVALRARAIERGRPLVHGPSPGHEPSLAGSPAAGPADAAAVRVGPAVPGDHAAAPGADPQGHGALFARRRNSPTCARPPAVRRTPVRVFSTPDTPTPGGAAAVQRPIPRDDHQRGRRLQPLEGPRRHALARRRHLRQLGHVLLHPRRASGRVLVDRVSADAQANRTATRRSSRRRSAEFRRRDHGFDTHTEIAVSPEDDIELRRVTHHQPLPDTQDDRSHQLRGSGARPAGRGRAASGVQQPVRPDRDRSRPAGDPLHAPAALPRRADAVDVSPDGRARRGRSGEVSYETDRMRFIGRGNTVADPAGDERSRAELSDSRGLGARSDRRDPAPDHARARTRSATVDIVSGVGETREACLGLVEKYQDRRLADRVFDLAWTHSQVLLRQINATEADAQLYGRLASSVIYANPLAARRPEHPRARTAAGSPACGATRSPAICRSCCCRSTTRPTSNWCASSSRPTPTGG